MAPGVLVALLASLAFPAFAPAYDWPVAPFDRQHPIRGTFDDPRTRTGHVDHDPTNPMSFHDGVDIQVPDGTPVYAIEGGEVFYVNRWAVSVVSPTWSFAPPLTFGYWHLEPVVGEHQLVGRHQLLGHVKRDAGHVHLSEQRFGRYVNPLRNGGLAPYADNTAPVIRQIGLRQCNTSRGLSTDPVSGCVDLVVNAFDPPSLQLHGEWQGAVFPPFRIAWSGLSSGSWLPAAARPPLAFAEFLRVPLGDVYAPGTTQNLRNRPGSYFFWLARDLDTRILTDGVYTIHVSVSDIRNNETMGTFRFTVADGIAAAVP